MAAIGDPIHKLNRFVVIGNRYDQATGKTESTSEDLRSYTEARQRADVLAADGFGCVVMDMDNRMQVYEMNKYLLAANMQSMSLPPMTEDQMAKVERRQIERDVCKQVGEEMGSFTVTRLREILQGAELGFPRRSGQTPQDCIQDWAWVK